MTTIQQLDFSLNLLEAILWQYNDAEKLQALLQSKQDWYEKNQTKFWQDFVTNIFDMRTADDFGLSVWSQILELPLYKNITPSSTKVAFGFGVHHKNFERGNFGTNTGTTINLPTDIKRIALQLRYFQLVTCGAVPEINRFMAYVFKNYGRVYLLDGEDMTQVYVFTFNIDQFMRFMLDNLDVMPRPAGVKSSYVETPKKYFGFGPAHVNFTRGTFGA